MDCALVQRGCKRQYTCKVIDSPPAVCIVTRQSTRSAANCHIVVPRAFLLRPFSWLPKHDVRHALPQLGHTSVSCAKAQPELWGRAKVCVHVLHGIA